MQLASAPDSPTDGHIYFVISHEASKIWVCPLDMIILQLMTAPMIYSIRSWDRKKGERLP